MRLRLAAGLALAVLLGAAVGSAGPDPPQPPVEDPPRDPARERLSAEAHAPGVRAARSPEAVTVVNDSGEWTVRTACVGPSRRGGGDLTVGPGYVSRLVAADGTLLVEDERGPGALNDPAFGGLGAFGWHHARGRPDSLALHADNAWELSGRVCAEDNFGFGVVAARLLEPPRPGRDEHGEPFVGFSLDVFFSDGYTHPDPLLRVRYRYRFYPQAVRSWLALTQLCPEGRCGRTGELAFVKEPKLVAHLHGDGPLPHSRAAVFDEEGELRCIYVSGGPPEGPVLDTGQCGHAGRTRLRFDGGNATSGADGRCHEIPCLDIVMRAYPAGAGGDVVPGGPPFPWAESGLGLDAWAEAAAARPAALGHDTDSEGVAWGCHGGSPADPLQRRWETTGRLDADGRYLSLGALFPAWEGGRGAYDCEPLLRTFGPVGETWAAFAEYSLP